MSDILVFLPDILVFLHVFVIVIVFSILTMSSMKFVASEIYDLFFSPRWGGGGGPMHNALFGQYDDPLVFWL